VFFVKAGMKAPYLSKNRPDAIRVSRSTGQL